MKLIIQILSILLIISLLSGCTSPSKYCEKASAEMDKGNFSGALLNYNKAIKLKPDYIEAYIGRGGAKLKLGDSNGALADYKKAVELKPDLLPPSDMAQSPGFTITNDIAIQARSLFQAKDYQKLDELAEQHRSSKESYADGVWKLSTVYDALVPSMHEPDDDWDVRLDTIARWTVARPDSITARVAWANVLVAYAWKARGAGETDTVTAEGWKLFFRRLTQATQILKQAKSLKEQCPIYYRVLMRAALGLQARRVQFDTIFDQAIKFEPDCETYYFGRAMYLLPQWYGAKDELQRDLAKSADKIGGETGDMLYAQVIWNINLRYDKNPFIEYNASWSRVDKGFEVIEKHFPGTLVPQIERANLAILANDARATVFYNSAREKQAKGDLIGATTDYNKAIEIKTNYVYAYVHLGILNNEKGDYKSAMVNYDKAVEIDPTYSTAYFNRGANKQSAGDIAGATSDFTKAIELRPDYALAYMARGQLKQIKGDNTGAAADFQQASKFRNAGK
jgi:tetratricopeptide (TPR) repeat protein